MLINLDTNISEFSNLWLGVALMISCIKLINPNKQTLMYFVQEIIVLT